MLHAAQVEQTTMSYTRITRDTYPITYRIKTFKFNKMAEKQTSLKTVAEII